MACAHLALVRGQQVQIALHDWVICMIPTLHMQTTGGLATMPGTGAW